jgi:hypothetical protein
MESGVTTQKLNFEEAGEIRFTVYKRLQTAGRAWYRGEHCSFNPALANMRAHDAIERYVLSGWRPPAPFIGPETRITTFGCCFVANISRYLDSRRYLVLNRDV